MTVGKPLRVTGRRATQNARVRKAMLKSKRFRRLKRQVGAAVTPVAKQNLPATIAYGASVVGCTPANLEAAKRMMGSVTGPSASGRSLKKSETQRRR